MSLYLLIQIWQPCPLISIVTGGIAGVGAYPTWDPTSVLGLFLVLFCLFVCLPHFNSALGTLVRANTHICLHTHRGIYSTLRHKRAHMLTRSHKHICKVLHKRTNAWTLPKIWPNASTHAANTHSPCLTDGTCQDAKTQPWGLASLKWLSASRESGE